MEFGAIGEELLVACRQIIDRRCVVKNSLTGEGRIASPDTLSKVGRIAGVTTGIRQT